MTSSTASNGAARWRDGVGKRCDCGNLSRCDHPWWIRWRYEGDAKSGFGPVTKFAFLLEPHQVIPTTRGDAEKLALRVYDWLVRKKPMPVVAVPVVVEKPVELTGNALFDRWISAVEPFTEAGKKPSVIANWNSKLKSAREGFGALPLSALGEAATMRAFVKGYLSRGMKLATPQRILATIVRPAVLWGQAKGLIAGHPFGKYGYTIDLTKEDRRTGRIEPSLEYDILRVCEQLNTDEREYAGGILADYLRLAIDTGGRTEYFLLLNKDVDWHAHKLALHKTKNGEARYVPFNPEGRVAALLQRRRFAGPEAPVLARPDGRPVTTIWKTWVEVICRLHAIEYVCTRDGIDKATMKAYKAVQLVPYLARHEAATWWGEKGVADVNAKFLQGHSSQYDTHGRYQHQQYEIARRELAEKVWPCEDERAVKADPKAVAR